MAKEIFQVGFDLTRNEKELLDIICRDHEKKRVQVLRKWIFDEARDIAQRKIDAGEMTDVGDPEIFLRNRRQRGVQEEIEYRLELEEEVVLEA